MQISSIHPNGRQISNGLRSFIFVFAYVNILEMKTKCSKQSSKPKQILSHFNIFIRKSKTNVSLFNVTKTNVEKSWSVMSTMIAKFEWIKLLPCTYFIDTVFMNSFSQLISTLHRLTIFASEKNLIWEI